MISAFYLGRACLGTEVSGQKYTGVTCYDSCACWSLKSKNVHLVLENVEYKYFFSLWDMTLVNGLD